MEIFNKETDSLPVYMLYFIEMPSMKASGGFRVNDEFNTCLYPCGIQNYIISQI